VSDRDEAAPEGMGREDAAAEEPGREDAPGTPEPDDEPSGVCAECKAASVERRQFLSAFVLGAGAAASASAIVPWLAMFLTPVDSDDPDAWREIGDRDDFEVGSTVRVVYRDIEPLPWAGFAARNAVWVRREAEDDFSAFTPYCTHVGCAVRWEEGARLFLCPCHGGAFHEDGSVAAGPPPRPLDRLPIRIRDGRVEIRPLGVPEQSG
jgi:menaquinol-cytochrome c reductase iron-sulfur subunit